jgi:hypothetical protein
MKWNMKMSMLGIEVDRTLVLAANVTFQVRDSSKESIHEMLVGTGKWQGRYPAVRCRRESYQRGSR